MTTGSLSEYAAHRGVAPPYVTKLKKAGRLVLVKVDGKERVDFVRSDRLVANTADLGRAQNGTNLKPAQAPSSPAPIPDIPAASEAAGRGGIGADAPGFGVDQVFRKAQTQERIFQAKTAELNYKKLSGELVDKKAVERTTFDAFRALRDHAFQVPQRAAARCLGLVEMNDIERVIAEELRKAFDGWESKMVDRMTVKGI